MSRPARSVCDSDRRVRADETILVPSVYGRTAEAADLTTGCRGTLGAAGFQGDLDGVGKEQIWSMLADGTHRHQLTTAGANKTPVWSVGR